jgi:hypothetical protein
MSAEDPKSLYKGLLKLGIDPTTLVGVGGSFFKGSVTNKAALPTPIANYSGELWIVEESSGGYFTALNIYKYPKGIYTPNADNTDWVLTPFNVKVTEDAMTLTNVPSGQWSNFIGVVHDINIGDRVYFNDRRYKNKTGVQTNSSPDIDTTNWEYDYPAQTLTVAISGGDFTDPKTAIESITDSSFSKPYTVIIYPGVYNISNPIIVPEYVTVIGEGIVILNCLNSGLAGVTIRENVFIKNITVQGGSNAFTMFRAGNALLEDITVIDSVRGVRVNDVDARVTVRRMTLLTTVGTMTAGALVDAGNLSISSIIVGSTSTVTDIINVNGTGSLVNINNVFSNSPNVGKGLNLTGANTIILNGVNLSNCVDGLVVSNGIIMRGANVSVFNVSQDGYRIDDIGAGVNVNVGAFDIENTGRYDINILSPLAYSTGTGKSILDKTNIVPGAKVYGILIDTEDGDEGVNILGECHVGTSLNPAETVMGGGDSHTFEYAYWFDGVSTYTDKTAEAKSFSGSTFNAFSGLTAGNCLYIANRFPLTFEGIKIAIETAGVMNYGDAVVEYWNGTAWTIVNGCTSISGTPFSKYRKQYFDQNGSHHIKLNPFMRDDWAVNDPVGLGTDYYWIRFRLVNTITTNPVIQQIKIHTNRYEINVDGTGEAHMDGRTYKKLVVDAVRPLEGNMQNGSLYVDENVGVGLENNRFTSVSDILGISFELPEDCDTSAPLIFVWKGKFAATGDINFTVRRNIRPPKTLLTNTEPVASGDTLVLTTGLINIDAAESRRDFRIYIDISDAIPSRSGDVDPFKNYGDEIWITLQMPIRGAGDFDYSKLSANYLSDFNGRHLRQ